jgi:hypothetical protein
VLPLLLQRGALGARAAQMATLAAVLVLGGGFAVTFVLMPAGQTSAGTGVG